MSKACPINPSASRKLNPVSSPWPFAYWGLDIVGLFTWAMGNRKFVLVVVDYFTKWAEVEALGNIRDIVVKKFMWRNIVTRFRVPESLVSDNGYSLITNPFASFAAISVSRIGTPPQCIHRVTIKLKPLTKQS